MFSVAFSIENPLAIVFSNLISPYNIRYPAELMKIYLYIYQMKNLFVKLLLTFILGHTNSFCQTAQFQWVNPVSVNGNTNGWDVACDAAGNVYTLGTYSNNFDADPGPGVSMVFVNGPLYHANAYIIKYNSNGNLIWAKSYGGDSITFVFSCTIDNNNNIYILGYYKGTTDFDPGVGSYPLTSDSTHLYLQKLDSAGNFLWAKDWKVRTFSRYCKVITDNIGQVYITSDFIGTVDSDPGPGVNTILPPSNFTWLRTMMVKLDSAGNHISSRALATVLTDIKIDQNGDLVTTGWFFGNIDFDTDTTVYNLAANSNPLGGSNSVFIAKYSPNWDLLWAKQLQGKPFCFEYWYSALIDQQNNIYILGGSRDTVDFDPGPNTAYSVIPGGFNSFVGKYDEFGNYQWVKQYGSGQSTFGGYAYGGLMDNNNNLVVTGQFNGNTDFNPGPGVYAINSFGNTDIYILSLDVSGNFRWVKTMGGIADESGIALAKDNTGNIYNTGTYMETTLFDSLTNTSLTLPPIEVDTYTQKFSLLTAGITSIGPERQFNTYPNPTDSKLFFDLPAAETYLIELYNLQGECVLYYQLTSGSHFIAMDKYAAGIYFIKITGTDGQPSFQKIIKH